MAMQPQIKTPSGEGEWALWYTDEFTGGAWRSGGANTSTLWRTRAFDGNAIAGVAVDFEVLLNGVAGSNDIEIRPNGLTTDLSSNGFSQGGPGGAPALSGDASRWLINGVNRAPKMAGRWKVQTRAGVYRTVEAEYTTYSTTDGAPHYSIYRRGIWLDLATKITYLDWFISTATVEFQNGTKLSVYRRLY